MGPPARPPARLPASPPTCALACLPICPLKCGPPVRLPARMHAPVLPQMEMQLQELAGELAALLPSPAQAALDELAQQAEAVEEQLAALKVCVDVCGMGARGMGGCVCIYMHVCMCVWGSTLPGCR